MKRKYSQAQNEATQRYIKKAYDEIKLRIPKGEKEKYKAQADAAGVSLNQYIIDAMEAYGKRDQV